MVWNPKSIRNVLPLLQINFFHLLNINILSLGIGKPPGQMDPKAFLLQKFSASARERVSLSWLLIKQKKGKRKKPIFQHESHLVIQFYYDFAWLYALCCAFLRAASFFFPRFVKTITVFLVFLKIDAALQEGVGVLKLLSSKGLTESARCFNTEQKYKHIRVQNMQA